MSVSTLTTTSSRSIHGSNHVWRNFRLMKKSNIIFGVVRQCLWLQCLQSLSCTSHSDILRQRDLRVKAGWVFKGGDQESEASIEHSDSAMEDIMFFFYQLDLGTRVQYALNREQYEIE